MHTIAYGTSIFVILLCIFTSAFSFIKISLKLRQQQAQVQRRVEQERVNGGRILLDIARYKEDGSQRSLASDDIDCLLYAVSILLSSRLVRQRSEKLYICYSPAGRSVSGKTVPEVLDTAGGRRPRAVLKTEGTVFSRYGTT